MIIDSGEKTCASSPGAFCQYLKAAGLSQHYFCDLFPGELRDENGVHSGPGWLQRHPECLRAETFSGG